MAVILIVDDEVPIVELLAEIARDLGHTVQTAHTGQTAWVQAQAHVPDLILSDVMMPGMGGYALLEAVRANARLGHTRVYLMSAASTAPIKDRSVRPDGFFAKPFDLTDIERLMEQFT